MNIIDQHYESLTKLYLRLKGYLVSNLIIHSEEPGNSKSELDIIAIRMPYNSQDYRLVDVEDYIESSSNAIEIIIADVKNKGKIQSIEFNKGLRKDDQSIKQLIQWIGIYKEVTEKEIKKFKNFLNLHRSKKTNGFYSFSEQFPYGHFNIKFTFFCPQLDKWNGEGFKYIHGEEIINFCWECLNETEQVESSSRRYDFKGWNELEEYVRFFKDKAEKVTVKNFEDHFGQRV